MRKLSRMLAFAVLMGCGIAGAAGASSIPVGSYLLTGAAVDGYQLTGSVTLDSGGLEADPGVGQLSLEYLPDLDSSGDMDLCVVSAGDCDSYQPSYLQLYGDSGWGYDLVDPTTTANSPTPEPGTLALVGTGILTVAYMTKKRKRYA